MSHGKKWALADVHGSANLALNKPNSDISFLGEIQMSLHSEHDQNKGPKVVEDPVRKPMPSRYIPFNPSNRKKTRLELITDLLMEAFFGPFGTPIGKFLAVSYISALALALLLMIISYVFSNLLGPTQIKAVIALDPGAIAFLNRCFNLILYALPAFTIASIGSATRLLLSDHVLGIRKSVKLIIGSGCFGILTFLSVESGVIVEFLTSSINTVPVMNEAIASSKGFYKTVLLCFLTGMFSTVIFITIDEKVKVLSSKVIQEAK